MADRVEQCSSSAENRVTGTADRIPVLLMVRELTLGGSERQLCEMAKALDPNRFAVHVGAFRPEGIRATELQRAGVPVLGIPLRSFRSPWRGVRVLRRYVREHRIQVINGFDPPSCLLIALAFPWSRSAARLTSQRNYQQVRTPRVRWGMRIAHRLADGIVVNCEAMREHLVTDERLRREHIHLCYNGLDTGRFRRSAAPPTGVVPDGAIVVGTLCALRPEKDLSTLLEAFAACRASDERLFLLVVGSGPEKARLEARAAQLDIGRHCRFEPTVADVVPWLSLVDLFVLPSRFEALPNALMEAMSCGCVCVASRVGGTPELIVDGETGFLFNPGDAAALAAHLHRLVADGALRARLVEGAMARIQSQFSLEASAARLGAIYEERASALNAS